MTRGELIPALLLGAVLVGRVLLVPVAGTAVWGQPSPGALAALLLSATVVTTLLAFRARAPLAVLSVVLVICLVWIPVGYPGPGAIAPIGLALYTVAHTRPLRAALTAAAAALLPTLAVTVWLISRGGNPGEAVTSALILALGAATGIAVRSQRQAREQAAARAAGEAEARHAAQRMSLARDLHDTIGHSMTIISVQTAAADRLIDRDPERARASLALVRQASVQVLDELAGALDLLRGRDENAPTSPVGPSEELTALVHTARAAGLQVTLDAPVLIAPQDVRAATYRIVQEGLTNARRHSPGAAVRIQVQRTGDGVQVSIDNDAAPSPAPASPGSGRGLPGMRERAEALGGTLDAGPTPGGGYRVLVRLPDGGTR